MIAFTTLFLGLVLGVVEVGVTAAPSVARVELVVDGRPVAETGPPFRARLDLGAEVAPHELVAVARDAAGREVGRARQWINRPRALAEAEFVLEPAGGGRERIARLAWRCVIREDPISLSVTFDGAPLEAADPSRIVLPAHAPERLHFLHAELDFGGDVRAAADAVFGGARRAELLTNLTAVPVLLDRKRRTPAVAELRDAFTAAGAPAPAVAVDEGPAEVVVVLAGDAADGLGRVGLSLPPKKAGAFRLAPDQTFRFVWCRPLVAKQRDQEIATFPMTPDVSPQDDTIPHLATFVSPPPGGGPPEIAKAVATAGLSAAARDRRRAVVLVVGADANDEGELAPEKARAFLERLRVPLFVWCVAKVPPPALGRWGAYADASTWRGFEAALRALSDHLSRQRVVWVGGTWLPQAIGEKAPPSGVVLLGGKAGGDGRIRTDE